MFKSKSPLICSLLGLMSISAQAACTATGCYDVYVDRLYATETGTIYVDSSGDENVLNCTLKTGIYMTIDKDTAGADNIYNLLLAAQTSNKKVRIRTVDQSTNCKISYVTLDRE